MEAEMTDLTMNNINDEEQIDTNTNKNQDLLTKNTLLDETLDINSYNPNQLQEKQFNIDDLYYTDNNNNNDLQPNQNIISDNDMGHNNRRCGIRQRDLTPRSAMKTRRQSKGIVYFNRKNPTIEITIGTLEEWYQEQQLQNQQNLKRRKMNTVNIDEEDLMKNNEEYVDLQQAKEQAQQSHRLNKTLLHETWFEDYQKEQKRIEQRNKKRKRQSELVLNRSRSRSPTPVTRSGPLISNEDVIMSSQNSKRSRSGRGVSSVQSDNSDYQKLLLQPTQIQQTNPITQLQSKQQQLQSKQQQLQQQQKQQQQQQQQDNQQTVPQQQVITQQKEQKEEKKEEKKQTKQNIQQNDNTKNNNKPPNENKKKGPSPRVSNKSLKTNSKLNSSMDEEDSYDSEEEDRKETEKIKASLLAELEKKDEPLDAQTLSTSLKYTQKHIEEGLKTLIEEGKVQKKEIGKKSYYISINQDSTRQYQQNKAQVLDKIKKLKDLEKIGNEYDIDLNKLEKQIKDLKLKPTSKSITQDIQKIQDEFHQMKQEIDEFKRNPIYLGDQMLHKLRQMYHKLDKLIEVYKKRKDGCMDILEYFALHLNMELQDVVRRCGINKDDLEMSPEIIEILGIDPEDLKKKKDDSDEEEEEEQEEDDDIEEEEDDNKTKQTANNRTRKASFKEDDNEERGRTRRQTAQFKNTTNNDQNDDKQGNEKNKQRGNKKKEDKQSNNDQKMNE